MSIILCTIILLSLLTACSTSETPRQPLTVAELLDLGEKYLLELNYEQALVQFLTVIEVEPMNPRGYTGAAEAYVGLGQPEMAIDILEKGQTAVGENESIQVMLDEIHRTEEVRPQAEIHEEKPLNHDEMDDEATIEIKRELDEMLETYEIGGFESILEIMESGAFREIRKKIKELPFISLNEDENYGIGIYPDYEGIFLHEGCLYIGEYVDKQRNGHGLWIRSLGSRGDRYEGKWANDFPNGHGTILLNTSQLRTYSGTLINGLWNGSVTYTSALIPGGERSSAILEFVNGKVITIGEPNVAGPNDWPVGYNDRGIKLYWPSEWINRTHGVFTFADDRS